MVLKQQISHLLRTSKVPGLDKIASLVEHGDVSVAEKSLGEGVQALYLPTQGLYEAQLSLSDAILLRDNRDWDFSQIYDRSVIVHEAIHARDDLQLAGEPATYIDAESRRLL